MAKIKLSLCGILWLCCLFVVVFGSPLSDSESEQLENSNSNPNPNSSEDSKCTFKCQDFKALENDNRQLKKSHAEILNKFELLSLKFDEFKNEISSDCGISLLKPPLRGPPGKPGVKGDIGQDGRKGESGRNGGQGVPGSIGPKGERGQVGIQGPTGQDGKPGVKGESGTKGTSGDRGPQGERGQKGERGQVGPPGQIGSKGEKGDRGDRGLTGSQGNSGADGRRGEKGDSGKNGVKGEKGDSGVPGSNGVNGQGFPDPKSITSCSTAMTLLPFAPRRVSIYPQGNTNSKRVEVLCDFETDGGGWTIIQKRIRGPKEEFKQNWAEYANGFGSLDGNFWLGLENIHALSKNGDQELRIELEDFDGEKKYVKYSSFSISDASDFYRLTLTGISGGSTLQDSFAWRHSGKKFSTMDKDNDADSGNCAVERGGGGWWFNNCAESNLNGLYFEKGETVPWTDGIMWWSWKGYSSLAKTEMKIRKRKT